MRAELRVAAALVGLIFAVPPSSMSCGGDESTDAGPSKPECAGKQNGDACSAGLCVTIGDDPLCVPECTIPGQTCELAETAGACYNTGEAGRHACLEIGKKGTGDPCEAVNDCAAGMACLSPDDSGAPSCHEVCDGGCTAGTCTDTGLGFSICAS